MAGICTVEGCDSPIRCKGVCQLHYTRLKAARKPSRACECGCGGLTKSRFVSGHNTRLHSNEEQARRARFNDGSKLRDTGLCQKTYRKRGQRHEHRIVAEAMLGRPLAAGEIVHHKNGSIRDNRPENLEVMTQSEHMREHMDDILAGRRRRYGN
jgi:hypothetical protein